MAAERGSAGVLRTRNAGAARPRRDMNISAHRAALERCKAKTGSTQCSPSSIRCRDHHIHRLRKEMFAPAGVRLSTRIGGSPSAVDFHRFSGSACNRTTDVVSAHELSTRPMVLSVQLVETPE